MLYEAIQLGMQDRLVYQPDTLITNSADAAFYRAQGCQGVSLAREITLEEICAIASRCSGVEMLVHGRFSIMHSRRQLLHSYFAFLKRPDDDPHGRRDLSLKEETREAHMPIIEDEGGTHVFSEYTLQSFAQIRTLVESGVSRLRIDSIFRDDDWSVPGAQRLSKRAGRQAEPAGGHRTMGPRGSIRLLWRRLLLYRRPVW